MEVRKIDMLKYRGGSKSTLYTGRPQGKDVRKELDLNAEDDQERKVIFVIPKDTTSFNPSFYLGLLYDSINKLTKERFQEKYSFDYSAVSEDYKEIIKNDLENGMRHAMNSIKKDTGFSSFL